MQIQLKSKDLTLLEELRTRKKITSKLSSKDIEPTLAKMYSWVMDQDRLEKYIEDLITVLDNLEPQNYSSPGIASLKDQAAIGFDLIGCCCNYMRKESLMLRRGIWDCVDRYNLIDYQNTRFDHQVPQIRDKYLLPFWDYLIKNVERERQNYTIESKINCRIKPVFDDNFEKEYPKTYNLIEVTNESLNNDQNTWNGVANSCRDILQKFGEELIQKYSFDEEIQKGNSKEIIERIISSRLKKSRYNTSLIKLFTRTWQHVSSALHRPNLKKREVNRIFIWTVLTITEIADI